MPDDQTILLSDFDFDVPEALVAQHPAPRGTSRMLIAPAGPIGGPLLDSSIGDLFHQLRPGDTLVLNDTKVLRARLRGTVATGGGVECLLLDPLDAEGAGERCRWEVMARPGKKLKVGRTVAFPGGVEAAVDSVLESGSRILTFPLSRNDFLSWLESHGEIPLPPYVRRAESTTDETDYQTCWAREPGAVAAPTAGLHLGPSDIQAIEAQGVRIARVTLHVGAGTFQPVSVENALDHPMHAETWRMTDETARILNETRACGGRIVCVGTTALRVVETSFRENGGTHREGSGRTRLFLHPLDPPRSAQGLLTNFHWPRTTLVLLAAGWLGSRERWREVYETALERRYRLFSYGDCMLSFRET